jgi:hypothetical protein
MEVERLLPSQRHFNNDYSEFEHTQPAGLRKRTAMNADEIIFISVFGNSHKTKKYTFKNI